MKPVECWMASATLVVTLLIPMTSTPVYAVYRVDCDAVMSELRQGKEPNEISSDLKIHEKDVHRCIRAGAKAQRKTRQTPSPRATK